MISFNEYRDAHKNQKVSSDIASRWVSRVLPRQLDQMGMAGAEQYLSDYGRGIAAPKCIQLALKAEQESCPEMALGFWAKAYELETKQKFEFGSISSGNSAEHLSVPITKSVKNINEENLESKLPSHLRPGLIVTMQPTDAPKTQDHYVQNDAYLGQPKRDGNRMVVIAESGKVFYQSRSTKLRGSPDKKMEQILKAAQEKFGTFVLDGELVYLDCRGGEHRTGAQAASVNEDLGQAATLPVIRFCMFDLLYWKKDLTNIAREIRLSELSKLGTWLVEQNANLFEIVPSYWTTTEKKKLIQTQKAEGREGEVWSLKDAVYSGGKDLHGFTSVRTKYLLELEVLITNLTTTTAEGRLFGAIEVARIEETGELTPLGSIGTGYSLSQMKEIWEQHQANPGKVLIEVVCQGFTESGKIWHGRFQDFAKASSR